MIVVSDTTPLNYLILIQRIEILNSLYNEVVVPRAVIDEMLAPGSPAVVSDWIHNKPAWLIVKQAGLPLSEIHIDIEHAETEAIFLAEQLNADLILLDDRRAREVAEDRGLRVVGTLGILIDAARRKMIDIHSAIADLKKSNFRVSQELLESALEKGSEFET